MTINLSDYSRTAAGRGWGPGWPTSRAADMVTVTADRSGVRLSVHRRVARLVDLLIDTVEARGYQLVPGWCWGYANRAIAGTNRPSNHSWGLALDINAPRNPYTTGTTHDIPDWMVKLFNRYGFAWGGHYSGGRRDYMHFEFMGTPSDADDMTALALRELAGAGGFLMALSDAQQKQLADQVDALHAATFHGGVSGAGPEAAKRISLIDRIAQLNTLFPPINHDAIAKRKGQDAGSLTNAVHTAYEWLAKVAKRDKLDG